MFESYGESIFSGRRGPNKKKTRKKRGLTKAQKLSMQVPEYGTPVKRKKGRIPSLLPSGPAGWNPVGKTKKVPKSRKKAGSASAASMWEFPKPRKASVARKKKTTARKKPTEKVYTQKIRRAGLKRGKHILVLPGPDLIIRTARKLAK